MQRHRWWLSALVVVVAQATPATGQSPSPSTPAVARPSGAPSQAMTVDLAQGPWVVSWTAQAGNDACRLSAMLVAIDGALREPIAALELDAGEQQAGTVTIARSGDGAAGIEVTGDCSWGVALIPGHRGEDVAVTTPEAFAEVTGPLVSGLGQMLSAPAARIRAPLRRMGNRLEDALTRVVPDPCYAGAYASLWNLVGAIRSIDVLERAGAPGTAALVAALPRWFSGDTLSLDACG